MTQTLHIFKKDVRYLRVDIAVILALMVLFAYTDSHSSPIFDQRHRVLNQTSELLSLLLPISWLYLVARLVHAEPLVGDRQFWLTRPYQWSSLLAAKTLFIISVISLPKAITDAIIVTARDLPLSHYLPGFACRELLIALAILLPFAALASVTSGLTQIAITVFVIVAASITFSEASIGANLYWGSLEWIRDVLGWLISGTVAMVIVFLQYRRRRTTTSRAIAIAAIILTMVPIPWALGFAIQSRLPKTSIADTVDIRLDPSRKPYYGAESIRGEAFHVPLTITGIPDGAELRDDRIELTLIPPKGSARRSDAADLLRSVGGYWLEIKSTAEEARGLISWRASMYLTMFGDSHSTVVPVGGSPSSVPGVGNCSVEHPADGWPGRFYWSICASAFRWPARLISVAVDGGVSEFRDRPYSPLPAGVGISPVTSSADQVSFWGPRPDGRPDGPPARFATITTEEPLAHFRREFVTNVSAVPR